MAKDADPYGRIMQVMGRAGEKATDVGNGFLIGEMISGAKVRVGDLTLAREDYLLLTNEIEVNGKVMKIPYKTKQEKTVTVDGGSIKVAIPPLKKGDKVLCYQIIDEDFVVFGKVE